MLVCHHYVANSLSCSSFSHLSQASSFPNGPGDEHRRENGKTSSVLFTDTPGLKSGSAEASPFKPAERVHGRTDLLNGRLNALEDQLRATHAAVAYRIAEARYPLEQTQEQLNGVNNRKD